MLRSKRLFKRKKTGQRHSRARNTGHEDLPFAYGHTQKDDANFVRDSDEVERDARNCYLSGLSHEKRGEYASALSDYDRAISLDPRLAWAYYHRGLIHGSTGNSRQQKEDFNAAARLGLWIATDMPEAGIDRRRRNTVMTSDDARGPKI